MQSTPHPSPSGEEAMSDPLAVSVKSMLESELNAAFDEVTLTRLAGDASNRRYHRVLALSKEGQGTYILMELMGDRGAKVMEEASNLGEITELPFLNVHRFLSELDLPVPKVISYDEAAGLLLLEDLGDVMLESIVKNQRDQKRIARLYRQAIELMARLHVDGTAKRNDQCIAFRQRFNAELFLWEFDHFLEYGVESREGVTLNPRERSAVRAVFEAVSRELDAQPAVLTHRDFHSRNLMVRGDDALALIDFQDALLGPAAYDLASLLRDSYVSLGEDVISDLVDYYAKATEAAGGDRIDVKEFRRIFDLQSVQRNLKAAGRFVFIDVEKGNDKFLRYVAPTLQNVRRNMEKYPELHPALDVLSGYVPELRT